MTISAYFQDAIDLVDNTKILNYVIDPTYDNLEYSVSGLTIAGGSDTACSIGASALLDEMNFRFYAPEESFWKLPGSINESIIISKTKNWIPAVNTFLVYGHSWDGTNLPSRDLLGDRYEKWSTLVGVNIDAWPGGHRWNNVITNSPVFFDANPSYLRTIPSGPQTFSLDTLFDTPDWDVLVEYCAAFLLSEGLNEFDQTNFDPVDGDDNISDHVFPFSQDVALKMRVGTDAIGGLPAQAAVPNATVGVYAYAGHRLPPSLPYTPGVYTQVTLAYNSTGLTLQELVEQHGELADGIAIRAYMDTQVWSAGRPGNSGKNDYLNQFDGYQAAGALSVNSEFTANWLVNIVVARAHVLKFRSGTVNWDSLIVEIVNDIFDGDNKVIELLTRWSDPSELFHKWLLSDSFVIVDQMQNSWYKTYFQQLLTIHYQYFRVENYLDYGIVRDPGQPGDTFADEVSKMLGWVTAVRDDDFMHSYALIRQEANTALNDYPELKFDASPEPDWFTNGIKPDNTDWTAAYAAILLETDRREELSESDLVMMQVSPVTAPSVNTDVCQKISSEEGIARYAIIGPAQVQVEDRSEEETFLVNFESGLHFYIPPPNSLLSWTIGQVFMIVFPEVRKDPDSDNKNTWLYIPSFSENEVELDVDVRWAFFDEEATRKDWLPGTPFPDLGPGQVAVDNTNTRGKLTSVNCGPYLSPLPNYALVSNSLADFENKKSRIKVSI